jgi:hypothetical protein
MFELSVTVTDRGNMRTHAKVYIELQDENESPKILSSPSTGCPVTWMRFTNIGGGLCCQGDCIVGEEEQLAKLSNNTRICGLGKNIRLRNGWPSCLHFEPSFITVHSGLQMLGCKIFENVAVGKHVGRVLADPIDLVRTEIKYSFMKGNELGHFTIHESTGVVSIAKAEFDFESEALFNLLVSACDTWAHVLAKILW